MFLGANRNFSASIGSFQRLRAELEEVVLFAQRLALKYNTTPRPSCQHFLTTFFQVFCIHRKTVAKRKGKCAAPAAAGAAGRGPAQNRLPLRAIPTDAFFFI